MLFRKKLIPFQVKIKYEYITSDFGVDVVIRNATEIEFAKSNQKLYRKLKKKFKYSNILSLEVQKKQ
jgi:hypothetical protein